MILYRLPAVALMLLAFSLASSATAQSTTAGSYLFDLIENPAFKGSFEALFKGESNVDGWLQRYSRDKNGPATPTKVYRIDGAAHVGGMVCMAHACGGNTFFFLFTQDGSKAVGLLVKGNNQRWFGDPSPSQRNTLQQMAKSGA